MKAIELALSSFKDQFQGKTIKWFTDNQNCVKIVKSGSMNLELQKLARSIYSTCVTNSISIDIQWIPRLASDPGFQYKELYLFNFLLLKLAKRSIVKGPQRPFIKSKYYFFSDTSRTYVIERMYLMF
jgi:hypothetical protein